MLQALAKKGRVYPEGVPAPVVSPGGVLIKVVRSCISAGTEMTSVTASGKSLVRRAMEQPVAVKRLLDMARTEGVSKAFAKVQGKLGSGKPLGYSVAGIVVAVGEGVGDFQPGDHVAAAGAGLANHAEYVDVPVNLVVPMPGGLDFGAASTVALGGIAMQGVRRSEVALGEFAVVVGVGILGQLAVQMLHANGARVIAVDLDERRLKIASENGAEEVFNSSLEDVVKAVGHYTGGNGADVVMFCAATGNPEVLSDAFAMTRRKGKLVMVGVWGNELRREDIYAKEVDFLISTSYGPGRYDPAYEEKGMQYPYAYVRWTEKRNMQDFLRLLATKRVNVECLIEGVYPIKEAQMAFESLQNPERPLIVLLDYGKDLPGPLEGLDTEVNRVDVSQAPRNKKSAKPIRVGLIGAGSFAIGTHLPNLQSLKQYEIHAICSRSGSKAQDLAKQFGAAYGTTDYQQVLADPDIDLVMICTRHHLHGPMVLESLKAGKNTFVEKPLCLKEEELGQIEAFYGDGAGVYDNVPLLMVGFNRRFAPCIQEIKNQIDGRINPLMIHYRMNAGHIPLDHWVHDPEQGGGRIVGEACHIVDLFSFLVGAQVRAYSVASLCPNTPSVSASDNKAITLEYEDGSVATLHYFSTGPKKLSKEYLEIYWDGKSVSMDDYSTVTGADVKLDRSGKQDKGHVGELQSLADYLTGSKEGWPMDLESQIEVSRIALMVK